MLKISDAQPWLGHSRKGISTGPDSAESKPPAAPNAREAIIGNSRDQTK